MASSQPDDLVDAERDRNSARSRRYIALSIFAIGAGLLYAVNWVSNSLEAAKKQRLPMDTETARNVRDRLEFNFKLGQRVRAQNRQVAVAYYQSALSDLLTFQSIWTDDQIMRATGINAVHWKGMIEAELKSLQLEIENDPSNNSNNTSSSAVPVTDVEGQPTPTSSRQVSRRGRSHVDPNYREE